MACLDHNCAAITNCVSAFAAPSSESSGLRLDVLALRTLLTVVVLSFGLYVSKGYVAVLARKRRIAAALASLPGPPGLPIVGNLLELGAHMHDLHLWKRHLASKYGATYAIKVDCVMDGSIVTNKPANIEHILGTNCSNYVKPPIIQAVCREVMGQSIFAINPESPLWACQRKLMANMFSVNSFRKYMDSVFLDAADDMLGRLEPTAVANGSINLEMALLTLTTTISFRIGFGRHVPAAMTTDAFHNLFREAAFHTANRFTRPWYKYVGALMPSEHLLKAAVAEIDTMLYGLIATRKAEPTPPGALDLLSQLLDQQRRGLVELSDTVVRDTMMTVLLAGRETVASGLLWIIYCLSTHPAVEAKLLAEVDKVTAINYDSMASLVYMEAVMKETWRLYPPTPLELKAAVADDILPDGTFVPAGVNVEFSPFVMNRDPARWTDPDAFVPERWLAPGFTPTDFEYPVFNAGKRKCVGQRIAMLQTKFILTKLYQRLRFHVVDAKEPSFALGISLFPTDGLLVRPVLRTSGASAA
ncbi:cytochrome P450 [Achlya hypogyna]|uniref:Cytochrome P450 n=1 Tax=Achlya hypogyna TaxID=1202772 RepID=A0A1V9ZRJ2_ACHHY|nr:cytochrome P450 [Achlya hypogyna]